MQLPTKPFRVEFEVNSVCNLSCVYCYAKPFSGFSPPFESLEYLFKKTRDEADPFEVVLVGGEPFLRRDIFSVINLALNTFENRVGISTNGTLLGVMTEAQMDSLRDLTKRNLSLQVSLDSVDPTINNKTRGLTERVMAGINALEAHAIPFNVGIVLTKANIDHIIATVKELLRFKQIQQLNLEPLQPTYVLGRDYYELRVDQNDLRSARNDVQELLRQEKRSDIEMVGIEEKACSVGQSMIDTFGFKTCTAGLFRAGVFADGGVTPCLLLRTVSVGNLFKESWQEIWRHSRERFLDLNLRSGAIIGQCSIVNSDGRIKNASIAYSR